MKKTTAPAGIWFRILTTSFRSRRDFDTSSIFIEKQESCLGADGALGEAGVSGYRFYFRGFLGVFCSSASIFRKVFSSLGGSSVLPTPNFKDSIPG